MSSDRQLRLTVWLAIALHFASPSSAHTQTMVIGTITDASTGQVLPGANVLLKGTFTGTVADTDGVYRLEVDVASPFTLIFSFVGYRSREFEIVTQATQTDLDVALVIQPIGSNEIIVTSQRREQELREVPASVSVLGSQTIEGLGVLNRAGEVPAYAPGLAGGDLSSLGGYLTMRGIGTNAFGIGIETSVGIFVDDIYAGRPTALASFLDVERIEVIRGPQNTLFGRNSSAGVISVVSNKPQNRPEVSVALDVGNEGQRNVDYVANYPVSDQLAVRLAGRYGYRDGTRTVINQGDQDIAKLDLFANRLSVAFRPTPDWSTHLSLEYQDDDGGGYALYSTNPDLGVSGNAFDRDIELSFGPAESKKVLAGRLQIDRILPSIRLQSLTGLRSYDVTLDTDADGSAVDIMQYLQPEESVTFSQNVSATGFSTTIDWLVAADFFYEDIQNTQSVLINDFYWVGGTPIDENGLGFPHPGFKVCDPVSDAIFGPCLQSAREDGQNLGEYFSYAAYGDLSIRISKSVGASAGLRFTYDDKQFETWLPAGEGVTRILAGDNILGPNTGEDRISESRNWSGLQPRINLQFIPSDLGILYGGYARGYKAGGFNTITAIPFDSETSNAFEVGAKMEFDDGAYKANLAGYWTDYTNLQVQSIVNTIIAIDNAADVNSKGVEVELAASPGGGFSILAGAAIGESRYVDYQVGDEDFSDNTPERSPDISFFLTGEYARPIRNAGTFRLRADYSYRSLVYFSRENVDELSQGSYGVLGAYVGLEGLGGGRLGLALFGVNLTDTEYLVHAEDAIGVGVTAIRNIPRLIGVRLNVRIV